MPFHRYSFTHYDHCYILALTDVFKPAIEQPGRAHAGTTSNLIGISQCMSYLGDVFRQQVRMSASNVHFTLICQFDFALQIEAREGSHVKLLPRPAHAIRCREPDGCKRWSLTPPAACIGSEEYGWVRETLGGRAAGGRKACVCSRQLVIGIHRADAAPSSREPVSPCHLFRTRHDMGPHECDSSLCALEVYERPKDEDSREERQSLH